MAADSQSRYVSLPILSSFCQEVLTAAGLPSESARRVSRSLAEADARSLSSHGSTRLLSVYASRLDTGSTNPRPTIRTVRQRGGVALIDGDSAPGQIAGHAAMDLAIGLAQSNGIGSVGVRNSSHFGIGALFVEQAIDADMIGLALTNAPPNMPPAGGRSRYFGTNPLAIGIPSKGRYPLVLDMSTSVVARGKITMAQKEGALIPAGWAIDADGFPTEDPAAALLGAVLPMAGYKGAGLALMIDVLCGVMTGAAFGSHIVDLYDEGGDAQNVGHLFVAIDIDAFMSVPTFKARLEQFVTEIRSQPRMPGVDRIYLPGEMEFESRARAVQTGVRLSAAGWTELHELAVRWNVSPLLERTKVTTGE